MAGRWLALGLGTLSIRACSGQAARAQSPEPIDHWNTGAVTSALQALGATSIQATTVDGQAALTARTRDDLNVGVYARTRDPAPPGVEALCHGLEAIISFDPGARADRRTIVERLNHQYAIGKFIDEPDGTIRLTRYVVFEGAVTPANLRAQLASVFAIGAAATQALWPDAAKR